MHWIKLASGAIIGLAALAGAVAVLADLLDKDPTPQVAASFAPLTVTAVTLDEFQAMQEFTGAEPRPERFRLAAAVADLAQATPGEDEDGDLTTSDSEQVPCPSSEQIEGGAAVPEGCPEQGQPCPTATDVRESGVTVPPGCEATGVDCPSESEVSEGATVPPGCPPEGSPDDPDPEDPKLATDNLNADYDMGNGCSGDPAGSNCALKDVAESAIGAAGGSRAEKLARVREVLAETRTRVNANGKREPMGIMVTVDVTVTGMSDEELKVYWSMVSARTTRALAHSWLRNTEAAALHPSASTQQIQKDIWLPLPRESGRYKARVTLVDESGEHYSHLSAVFH